MTTTTMALALGCLAILSASSCVGAPMNSGTLAPVNRSPAPAAATKLDATSAAVASEIDHLLRAAWAKRAITPSAPVDDARFLRRVYLDVVGVIPPPERVVSFANDAAPDKRNRIVTELLASTAYADHWTAYWDDVLMGQSRAGNLDRQAFRVWLHDRFENNDRWNALVYALVTATGENSTGGPVRRRGLAATERAMEEAPFVSGAVNYAVKFRDAPQDFAGNVSKTFLGTQIQCAQCHDHKTEPWTQEQFQKFAASFSRVAIRPFGDPNSMKGLRVVDVRDLDRPAPRFGKNADLGPIIGAAPTALDGTPMTGNVRQSVARWITSDPSFARAIVNRMWGHFLGRGFSNPVDDLRPTNPVDAPEVLDRLTRDFVDHGYDLKRLMAVIAATEVYRLAPSRGDAPLWSQFRIVPLGPEELVNSILAATGAEDALARSAHVDGEDLKLSLRELFSFVFDVDEEFDQARYEGTLAQALVLLNGKLTSGGSTVRPGTALQRLVRATADDRARIEAVYLRTLSRRPARDEIDALLLLTKDAPKAAGLEDVTWALLNSSEFAFNH